MNKDFITVLNSAVAEIEEKKSRFIASVKPVCDENEAVEFINGLKTRYWDATHNVYAYYITGETTIQRFSDDGEPSGTAGMPVLEVIKRMGISNLVVVVTRYFGGTLLGAAGLIRAYSKSAAAGISAAGIVTRLFCYNMLITIEYALLGKIQNLLHSEGFIIKDVLYGQDVDISVFVPEKDLDRFNDLLIEASNANILIDNQGKEYITIDENGNYIKE